MCKEHHVRAKIINPRRMRRRVTVLVLCACLYLSATTKSTAYLVFTSQTKVLYGVSTFLPFGFP